MRYFILNTVMPDPDPAPPAFITMGDPASPEGIPLRERGMTPFLDNPMYFFDILESNSGFKLNRRDGYVIIKRELSAKFLLNVYWESLVLLHFIYLLLNINFFAFSFYNIGDLFP